MKAQSTNTIDKASKRMNAHDATEAAFRNGYEQGKKDAVKHGKLIKQGVAFDLCGIDYYNCSLCDQSSQIETPFCPHCSAKTDK